MLLSLPVAYRGIVKTIFPVFLMFVVNDALAQCQPAWPHAVKGTFRTNINVGAGGFYNGLVEYLPPDYNTAPLKDFPVIIFIPGKEASGNGTTEICRVITDLSATAAPPTHILNHLELGTWGSNLVPSANGTNFIVLVPQYRNYNDPFHYSEETDDLIDYVISQYRVDEDKIFLTGLSAGANIIIDYLGSSVAHASRVAAAGISSLCFLPSLHSSTAPQNIADGGTAMWFAHCILDRAADNVPWVFPNTACDWRFTTNAWDSAIRSYNPVVPPRLSILPATTPGGTVYPDNLNYCRGFAHDSWSYLYTPSINYLDGDDNFYEWALAAANAALPVTLKSFTARLSNGKVYLRWVTSSEQENHGFVIERAGSNGSFSALTQVGGGGNTSGDKVYEYVDENPLTNLSFYRLKQQDLGGRFRYFDTRKVMNKGRFKSAVLITPNPFYADPSAFVNVDKKQRINVWLTDMSGRVLSTVNQMFEEGTSELSLPTGNLPRGVYFVKVRGENISETHKIIKQ